MDNIIAYPGSAVMYIALVLACTCLAWWSEKSGRPFGAILIAILLILVAGFRTEAVGIDTAVYLRQYEQTLLFGSDALSSWTSSMYPYLMEYVSQFGTYKTFVFLSSVPLYALLIARFWELRQMSSFPIMVFSFCCLLFPLSLNVVRQFLAVSIAFWGSRYFFKRQFVRFVACVLVASLIHQTSFICLVLFAFLPYISSDYTGIKRTLLTLAEVLVPVCVVGVFASLYSRYAETYLSLSVSFGFMGFVKLCFASAAILWMKKERPGFFGQWDEFLVIALFVTGILLSFAGYFFSYMDRAALFFLLFEPVAYGIFAKRGSARLRQFALLYVLAVCSYTFVAALGSDSQGIMPYAAYSLQDVFGTSFLP